MGKCGTCSLLARNIDSASESCRSNRENVHVLLLELLSSQGSGLVLLSIGVWIAVKLHRYLELDEDISSALPLLFVGLGLFILILATLACGCAVKGNAPKLYIVSWDQFHLP